MTVDDYLEGTPEPQRRSLVQLRESLKRLLPSASEEVSYGMPAFRLNGKVIAGYAAFKGHCSYFPHSGNVLPTLADELEGYDWSGGTLRFPVDGRLPDRLVARLVRRRLEQLGFDTQTRVED